MARPYSVAGRTVLVTGAGSGIGRALAIEFARSGAELVLVDIDGAGLKETEAELTRFKGDVVSHCCDVGCSRAVAALAKILEDAQTRLDVLVNNAGIAFGGSLEETSDAVFEQVLSVNLGGVVRMSRALLPVLRRSDDAMIVNVSSVFGLVGAAHQSAYTASKFAIRGFSEALRRELATDPRAQVGVSTVYPGGVATRIAANARYPSQASAEDIAQRRSRVERTLKMAPEHAAKRMMAGIVGRKPRILIGRDVTIVDVLERLAPSHGVDWLNVLLSWAGKVSR